MRYDFSGWATRNDLPCSDGRTIRDGAFRENDGQTVPLVWNHQHSSADNVLGHALLEYRPGEGMYTYCTFNNTEMGQNAKELVKHGDVTSLSIYANRLTQRGGDVLHGAIREVSLVLAGANPGAFIDTILEHGDCREGEAIIYTDEEIYLSHAEDEDMYDDEESGETIQDVFDTLTEKQKKVVYALIGQAVEQSGGSMQHCDDSDGDDYDDVEDDDYDDVDDEDEDEDSDETVQDVFDTLDDTQKEAVYTLIGAIAGENEDGGESEEMKHNLFDNDEYETDYLSHSEMLDVIDDAKRFGSMKESCLQHGIDNLEYLFPDYHDIDGKLHFIGRDTKWVDAVMSGVHHSPFSKIKTVFADITADEARALGYMKGNLKKEEMFTLLKRTTEPTTIYKKQKFDRDDIVDITDFDVIGEVKSEMRVMLNEEIARAILIGDGRSTSSDDKVDELKIRPIWTDDDFYTIHSVVDVDNTATDEQKATEMVDQMVRSLDEYKGSGNLTLFIDRKWLTAALLTKDSVGHRLYKNADELATAMLVDKIIPVPVMKNKTRNDGAYEYTLMGIAVDLNDYNVGADKGGEINMFDDFDIDYNQQKYLIETRISGSLVKPYGAIALELKTTR